MAADDVIIFVSSRAVWRVSVDPTVGAVEIANAIASGLVGRNGEVVVAVPSAWCLVAQVESSGDPRRDDRKSMLFRLEEKLPLAAEEMVADFIAQSRAQRRRALGVAARLDVLRPVITAAEGAGVTVRCVSPLVLLAAQNVPSSDNVVELWPEGGEVNVIARRGNDVIGWSLTAGSDRVAIRREIDVHALTFAEPLRIEQRDQLEAAAVMFARNILAGRARPSVQLRRGPLAAADPIRSHRRPLNLALAAAAAFLILLTGAMLFRAVRYERLAKSYERQLSTEFARVFPDWPPPGNVRAVIDSEFRKAQAVRSGATSDTAHASALRTMHDVLSRFPTQAKCDVDRLSFGDGSFELQGRVAALEDVEPLAMAARDAGLEVPPPLTRRGEDGLWTVTLRGARPQPGIAMVERP